MPPKSFEQPHNQGERVATSMYNLADKVDGAKQPDLHRTFNEAANNFATENYDKGQRLLEKTGLWNDDLRAVASEANRANSTEAGTQPLTFADAKRVIAGYGEGARENLEDTGGTQDLEAARSVEAIMRDLDKPGQAGVEGLDKALNYVEGLLQTSTQFEQKMSPATKQRWDERRAVRDALFAEKQKRAEQLKQQQQTGERISHDRTSATRNLENLYANAGVPENTPSRQELMRRVSRMSNEELHFLGGELRKIGAKFNTSGDAKSLDADLSDLLTKQFTKEQVKDANKQTDQEDLGKVRQKLFGGEQTGSRPDQQRLDRVLGDPAIQKAFENNRDSSQATPEKVVNVTLEVFKELYPESQGLIARLEKLGGDVDRIMAESKQRRPDLTDDAHQRFAVNTVLNALSQQERRSLELSSKSKLGFTDKNQYADNKVYVRPDVMLGELYKYVKSKLG